MQNLTCRACSTPISFTMVDLGTAPLCQRHVTPARFNEAESVYPQRVYVCESCFLVQLPQHAGREEIFDAEYGYFSSISHSWLRHCQGYACDITQRLMLGEGSMVTEIASNDGYMLQFFKSMGIPCYGVEPTANTAMAARHIGIETIQRFFGIETARFLVQKKGQSNLILGNNVLAHVPDINDFIAGMKILLAPGGVITMEFPVLSKLIENNLWDTIYHEHFSYLSFTTVREIFAWHGLIMFDVEDLPTHGGSIRIYARHVEDQTREVQDSVRLKVSQEMQKGHATLDYYSQMADRVARSKRDILSWFIEQRAAGHKIAGYGAPGKGNTLLNYCGIRSDMLSYVVDDSPHKQNNYLPGSRIPIYHPSVLMNSRPDFVVLMPWNLKTELQNKLDYIKQWGGKCVVLLPEVQVLT